MSARRGLVALAVVALAVGIVGTTRGAERERYVAANEALLEELPLYAGAERKLVRSSAYYDGDAAWSPVAGYTTLALYELPAHAIAEDVAAFYEQALAPEWRLVETIDESPSSAAGPILSFRRGSAVVSINLESHRAGILEISVDHARGD